MASAQSSVSEAICRLVEETSGHETIKFLGPGCLASFRNVQFLHSVGTPKSNSFLVASNQVLTKSHLRAIENQDKEKSKRSKPSVKIVAEFLGTKEKLERKPLGDLYRSLDDDVFELDGIIYVALTKLEGRFSKSSLLRKTLEASSFVQGRDSSWDQLQCLVFCRERAREERSTVFSTKGYDLLEFDSVLRAADDSRFPQYFLCSEERKRYLKEDEFEEGEKPLGAVIVSKDYHLAGFLNFINKTPAPVLIGIESGEKMQHEKIETELLLGASGGVYPLLGPNSSSQIQAGTEESDKTNRGNNSQLDETTAPLEKVVAEFQIDGNSDNKTDVGENVRQPLFVIGGDNGKELPEEQEQEFAFNGGPFATENSYRSMHASVKRMVVNLPPLNGKDTLLSEAVPPDESSSQSLVKDNEVFESQNNNLPQDRPRDDFPEGFDKERRRHSFPSDTPKKEEHVKGKRCTSASTPRLQKERRKFNPDDPLAKTILGYLEVLEGLSRSLDKEYKYGACKCWKHAAEYFEIKEEEYQNFKCNLIHSPTEVMFEYLQTCSPEITIGDVKDGLGTIGRQDVIDVLVMYEQTYQTLDDETLVCSLFDSDPDVIGEMALLLDRQKVGVKNWSHLAAKLNIPRKVFKTFETCNTDNPSERLFEILKIRSPRMTIGELIGRLEAMQRRDVVNAIRKSTKVKEGSLLKDLMGDLSVMDEVCDLLNKKQRTKKVLGWKHLGDSFGIEKEILDDLTPTQEELECPTEVLIRYLGGWKPYLKIADFIWALHMIDRDDTFTVLDDYLPDGCIPRLLASCHCNRCQMRRSQHGRR